MTTTLSHSWVKKHLPLRAEDAHKGSFGHVLVFAGSPGFTGAARLACAGAARSGAGLVTLGIANNLCPLIVPGLFETMWRALPDAGSGFPGPESIEAALELAQGKDAVVMGPGLGQNDATYAFVEGIILGWDGPLVLDADALNLVSESTLLLSKRSGQTVVTPHPGEMARLLGKTSAEVQANRKGTAQSFADTHQVTVVLKGHRCLVASPDAPLLECPLGNHGMATGGTGDVLAGLIGGWLAQAMPEHEAAGVAVYVHALAGDIAAAQASPRALIAGDLVAALGQAWQQVESP